MSFAPPKGRDAPLVDVTPLIDIIFQLVLFFMVSTTFVTTQGIEVDLPRSSSEAILREREDIRIKVTTDGAVYVEDDAVSFAELTRRVQQAARTKPGTMVIISADKDVDHGRVVAIMDLARRNGMALAIATEANTDGAGDGAGASAGDGDDGGAP